MSNPSWPHVLKTALPTKTAPNPRVVVMGIGSDLRGDDAAGPAVVRALTTQLGDTQDRVRLIDAGAGPENFTGPVRRFDPALVILVDAALMGDAPGAVQWLAWEDTVGLSASTHTLPPYLLAKYLTGETGCTVAVIGIQPSGNGLGDPLSPPVAAAVEAVSAALADALA